MDEDSFFNSPSHSAKIKVREKPSVHDFTRLISNVPRHRQVSSNVAFANATGAGTKGLKVMGLNEYLYTKGFLEGQCSDVCFVAFGQKYHLHKLILHRSPYFSALFNGIWDDQEQPQEINIDQDENITKEAFDLALARLYGHEDAEEEKKHLYGLLVVASFLDLPDLADSCVQQIINTICSENVGEIVSFCTACHYGKPSTKILEGCKSFLCCEALDMQFEHLDAVPEKILAEVLTCDGFFVPNELARCYFIIDVYNQKASRMKEELRDLNELNEESLTKLDIIKDALNTGVHYCHISGPCLFELEQFKDVQNKPLIGRDALREGLWLRLELEQKVAHAGANNSDEVGLTQAEWDQDEDLTYYVIPVDDGETKKYTRFPPFRFSVVFDDISGLLEQDRQYSETIWAAGSFWKVYVQKAMQKKNVSLGVYLYRGQLDQWGNLVKDPGTSASLNNNDSWYRWLHGTPGGVPRLHYQHQQPADRSAGEDDEDFTTMAMENLLLNDPFTSPGGNRNGSNTSNDTLATASSSSPTPSPTRTGINQPASSSSLSNVVTNTAPKADYLDKRKTISSYFEIYTPSKKANKKSLTCFSSSPDKFDFAQSWGWKSHSLAHQTIHEDSNGPLKFMVVIGLT